MLLATPFSNSERKPNKTGLTQTFLTWHVSLKYRQCHKDNIRFLHHITLTLLIYQAFSLGLTQLPAGEV